MILLALMLASSGQEASLPNGTSFTAGVGNVSCAEAWSRDHAPLSFIWTQGFWSGLNYVKSASIGSNYDAIGIVSEVKKTCSEDNSQILLKAVVKTYLAMERS